jgi:hypothetical protein
MTAAPVRAADTEAPPAERRHEIPYQAYEGSARRIIIQVTLNGRAEAPIAVDTGAPATVISMALAERLGLLGRDSARLWTITGGIGGRTPAILTVIDTIAIGDIEQHFFLTTVVPGLSDAFEGLLGMDFLAPYTTQIDPRRNLFILQEMPQPDGLYGGRDETWWRSNFRLLSSLRQAWQAYYERLDRTMRDSRITTGTDDARSAVDFARAQTDEATELLDKLNSYAVRHLVPMHWREY